MIILGIESSCDETAAALVEIDDQQRCRLLSNVVSSSMDLHKAYGGVVPEIAARSHVEAINPVITEALTVGLENARAIWPDLAANDPWDTVDGIAVTYGAGLGGCLLVGVMTARTLAIIQNKPLYAINHVEGHVYANFITQLAPALAESYKVPAQAPQFPLLALIVSGGHSQLALFRNHFDYTLLGQTQDDAIGEAFDKVAKVIGLSYPGGPSIGKAAMNGDPHAFNFPKAKMTGYNFSFSGVKTAVLRGVQQLVNKPIDFPSFELAPLLSSQQQADIAASFQRIAVETVVDKTIQAYEEFHPKSVVIAGGVAASPELRRQLAERLPIAIDYTDPKLCTDNGAMIAALGCFKAALKQSTADPYTLAINPNLSM